MTHLTHKYNNINYFRYVDDILLIFEPNHTDIKEILKDFNALHPNLQFRADVERDNTLNYLDISIHKTPKSLNTAIHRKPTFTHSIIPYKPSHPKLPKYTGVKFLFNRLNSYILQNKEYQLEQNVINNILFNNSVPMEPLKQTAHTKTQKK